MNQPDHCGGKVQGLRSHKPRFLTMAFRLPPQGRFKNVFHDVLLVAPTTCTPCAYRGCRPQPGREMRRFSPSLSDASPGSPGLARIAFDHQHVAWHHGSGTRASEQLEPYGSTGHRRAPHSRQLSLLTSSSILAEKIRNKKIIFADGEIFGSASARCYPFTSGTVSTNG